MTANKIRWLRLQQQGLILARGEDAVSFLQGQLSNDVRLLSETRAQISSYNTPKGRMLAVLHLFRHSDGIAIEVHRGVLESVLKRLRMFVLRSKVRLEDASTALPSLGLWGAEAPQTLERLGLPAPTSVLERAEHNGVTVLRRQGETPRFTLHASPAVLATLESQWGESATENDWALAEIDAGVPTIHPETQDRFVPQWCNLDRLGGISFDKGCYTGQEIVARIHYLGEVKRRMHVVSPPAALPPGADSEQGEVVISAVRPDGALLALAVQKV